MLEGKATWSDLKTMSFDEVDLLNAALDSWQEAEQEAHERAQRKARP